MTRREFAVAAGAASLALGFGTRAQAADAKTLRFIMRNDLRVLDPMWTTAYVTRNHAYMVFDTLFALDDKFNPRPQMVGDYSISADKLRCATGLDFTTASRSAAPIAWLRSSAGWRATLSARRSPR
jgi:hypothetical protein